MGEVCGAGGEEEAVEVAGRDGWGLGLEGAGLLHIVRVIGPRVRLIRMTIGILGW